MNKILVIVGPTASGKSELAVRLAKKFNGEIVSCDSRQIYRGMDLGTGKISGKWLVDKTRTYAFCQHYFYKGITHHCIDYINPRRQYSAALFQRDAKKAIENILARGKLPILCGGTAHWIDSVVFNQHLPDVKPNAKLRKKLEKLSTKRLFARINRLDPERAKTIDKFNKRRLIRSLEIIMATGKPVPPLPTTHYPLPTYDALWLGINPPQNILFAKIKKRLKQRLGAGMVKEVMQLHRGSPLPLGEGLGVRVHKPQLGLSWHRLESFGLEYKFVSLYLQKKISYDEMFEQLFFAIKHYTKRQMTWWKRNKEIRWIKKYRDAEKLTKKFL